MSRPSAGLRLTGIDGVHLHLESDRTPMHTLKVLVLEPLEPGATRDVSDLMPVISELARSFGLFRMVPVPTPLGLDQPLWFEQPDLRIEDHVRVVAAAYPGGARELDDAVSKAASGRLRADRPLWEITLIEGLADGRVGLVIKLHHALADGVAAANQLAAITGADEWPRKDVQRARPPRPSAAALATLRHRRELISALPALVRRTRRVRREVRELGQPRISFSGPRNLFHHALTAERTFATVTVPLQDVRAIRALAPASDLTINDVMLSVVGGAVRSILLARGELPRESLVTGVPVSIDPPDAPVRLFGNGWAQMVTTLGTDIADPVERLIAIHRTTAQAKRAQKVEGDLLAQWMNQVPPFVLTGASRLATALRLNGRVPLPGVSVSNVRGPAEQARLPQWGLAISDLYSVGQILDGVGLNVTAWSYAGQMKIAVLTCTGILPAAREMTDAIAAEFERLRALLAAVTGEAV